MHKSKWYLVILVVLFVIPQMAYAQDTMIKPAEEPQVAGGPALFGPAALQDAETKGLIRRADMDDVRQYLAARAKAEGLPDHLVTSHLGSKQYFLDRAYMVLSADFIIPRGLRNNFKFIVPKGLAKPKGPRGSLASVYSYDELKSESLIADAWKFPNLPKLLPAKARVFAFDTEHYNYFITSRVDVQIDPSTPQSFLIEITVNSPSSPAILFLHAHNAIIWHFNWTKDTKIAAVYISSQYKQAVSGLPEDVPVFIEIGRAHV